MDDTCSRTTEELLGLDIKGGALNCCAVNSPENKYGVIQHFDSACPATGPACYDNIALPKVNAPNAATLLKIGSMGQHMIIQAGPPLFGINQMSTSLML